MTHIQGGEGLILPAYMQRSVDAVFGPERISPLTIVTTETGRCVGRVMMGATSRQTDIVTAEQTATEWEVLTGEEDDGKSVDISEPTGFGGLLVKYVSFEGGFGSEDTLHVLSQEITAGGIIYRDGVKHWVTEEKAARGRKKETKLVFEDSEEHVSWGESVGHPGQELLRRSLRLLGDPYIDSASDLFDPEHAVDPDSKARQVVRGEKRFGPVVTEALIQVDSRLGLFTPRSEK